MVVADEPQFTEWVRSSIHECAPDHSLHTVEVGKLRQAAKVMAALYDALIDSNAGQRTWGTDRKIQRALAAARAELR